MGSESKLVKADLKVIKGLQSNFKLLDPVINVLIDFVLFTQDFRLPKSLIDEVAGHWSRKKVSTVKQAVELARSELKYYQTIIREEYMEKEQEESI
ncbi:DnaD domain protein [Halalkalibacter lacteus]|uniref:DnaD domain protein n=1 Tax=Halalkalibacter lacteus TaxID=3090663 RepID=UPI002FCAC925